MKRIISILFAIIVSMVALAQKDVTKFMGIPVDGTISEMKAKLKAKGFKEAPYGLENELEGEFNGHEVYVSPVANNGKVWRICVRDKNSTDETNIRIRFNNLVRQFNKNSKYVAVNKDIYLDDNEDISYNMTVKKKRYEADYFQMPSDTNTILNHAREALLAKYSQEQIQNPTQEQQEDIHQIINQAVDEVMENRMVWFMITEIYGKYGIIIYYENGYNQNNGEDL